MFFESSTEHDVSPMRILALYLATFVDTWPHIMSLHKTVIHELANSLDSSELLLNAKQKVYAHLEQRERATIADQDMLIHTVVRAGREEFSHQLLPNIDHAKKMLAKLPGASEETKDIIEAYYVLGLRGIKIQEKTGLAAAKIAAALYNARHELDWIDQQGTWKPAHGESSLPSLIQDYMQGEIDKDSYELLTTTLSDDLTKLAAFERQWRLHVLLLAAFTPLPFPENKGRESTNSFRKKSATIAAHQSRSGALSVKRNRNKATSSSGTRSASGKSTQNKLIFAVGGSLVLILILGIILISGGSAPLPKNDLSSTEAPPANESNSVNTTLPAQSPKPTKPIDTSPLPPTTTTPPATTITATQVPTTPPAATPSDNQEKLPITPPTSPPATNTSTPIVMQNKPPEGFGPDLLSTLDLQKAVVNGAWLYDTNKLVVEDPAHAQGFYRIQVPTGTPVAYDVRLAFSVNENGADLACIINYQGQQCVAVLGAEHGTIAGFSLVGNQVVSKNTTSVQVPPLKAGQRYEMEVRVRKSRIELCLDNTVLTAWEPTMGPLTMDDQWELDSKSSLGIGMYAGNSVLYGLYLREVAESVSSNLADGGSTAGITSSQPKPSVTTNDAVKTPPSKDLRYITLQNSIYSDLLQNQFALCRSRLKKSLSDPAYAANEKEIQLDLKIVDLHQENFTIALQGVKLLEDGKDYTIVDNNGKQYQVGRGRPSEVAEVTDTSIIINEKVGDGIVSLELPIKNLSPLTLASLIRTVKSTATHVELRAALYEILLRKFGKGLAKDYQVKDWFSAARSQNNPKELTDHLEAIFNELVQKQSLADQLLKIEKQFEKKLSDSDLAAIDASIKRIGDDLKSMVDDQELEAYYQKVQALVAKYSSDLAAKKQAEEELKNAKVLHEWNFKGGVGLWRRNIGIANLRSNGTDLIGQVRANEAYILSDELNISCAGATRIEIVIQADRNFPTQVYFSTKESKQFQIVGEALLEGKGLQTLRIDVTQYPQFQGIIKELRVHPINPPVGTPSPTVGVFAIRSIKIVQ